MNASSNTDELVLRCQELEVTVRLLMAANDAKAERMEELEQHCRHLEQRVARLTRRAGAGAHQTRRAALRHAR